MYGSYTKEMLDEVHPQIHQVFQKAIGIVQAPVAGFDLIIEDPTKDPSHQKWGIIECNSLPFIDLHYFALEGPQINLAKNVWDLWKDKL
jgi:cyanophycin synthetase